MGASKRSNYSGTSNRRSTGGEALRNVGVVLGLGGLSFFLGFFVLSHMVPDKGVAAPAVTVPRQEQTAQASPVPSPSPAPAASAPAVTSASPSRTANSKDGNGPTIEPADDAPSQKPAPLDSAENASPAPADSAGAGASTPGTSPTTTDKTNSTGATRHKPGRSASAHSAGSGSASADASLDSSTENGGFKTGDQKPSKIDPDGAATPARTDNSDSATGDTPKAEKSAVKSALYRVRGGTHSRREEAEREAHRITDLGLDATVVPVTTDDGTVYRVQQGVYRKRANAEAARQKLADAGIDAEIVKAKR